MDQWRIRDESKMWDCLTENGGMQEWDSIYVAIGRTFLFAGLSKCLETYKIIPFHFRNIPSTMGFGRFNAIAPYRAMDGAP